MIVILFLGKPPGNIVYHVCSHILVADPAKVVVVGGADGAPSVPACLAKARSVSEAGLDHKHAGAADE